MQVFLNQFFIKTLTEEDRRFYRYRCVLEGEVATGQEFQKIGSICYKVGTDAVRLGNQVVTRSPLRENKLRGEDWRLEDFQEVILNPADPKERKAIAQLELKKLKADLKLRMPKTHMKDSDDGKLTMWKDQAEKFGNGWKVYRSTVLGLVVQINGDLLLEIDSHSKFHSPYTLHQWQEEYPDCPINYVLNTYPDQEGKYRTWLYEERTDESPYSVILLPSEQTLAQYHLSAGATLEDVEKSYVVYVKSSGYGKNRDQSLPHLSRRLRPILTMDTLGSLAENPDISKQQKLDLSDVFRDIKINIDNRFQKIQKLASAIIRQVYDITTELSFSPLEVIGLKLGKSRLYGREVPINKTADVFTKGCAKAGELNFGCLNLADNAIAYPTEIKLCLENAARTTGVDIFLQPPRINGDVPRGAIEQQLFWAEWAASGIKTILVIGRHLRKEQWQKIRVGALQAGIATQFMRPMPQREEHRARNIALGLLVKAAWQSVRLEPIDHPQVAELIIGFDTGTNRELYYGTAAFAVLADGQSLGWELPNIQRGETFSGEAVWQTVSSLLMKFYQGCGRLPKQVLLMRDGLIQDDEFERTIAALEEKGIGIDVIGVRKSGGGRMGIRNVSYEGTQYNNAPEGTIVLMEEEKSFLLVGASVYMGSARPLRVIHEYGNTPLELIARQVYQQCQLHPASGYRHARLPWVLHLADKSSKEFQKVGAIAPFQYLDREKLFSV